MIAFIAFLFSLGPSSSAQTAIEDVLKLRDPFLKPDLSKYLNKQEGRTEIQQFAVQEFQLTGVITGPRKKTAMLVGPNGKTYYVNETMKIGLKDGVITQITTDELTVRETTTNLIGQVEESTIILPISAGDEGKK